MWLVVVTVVCGWRRHVWHQLFDFGFCPKLPDDALLLRRLKRLTNLTCDGFELRRRLLPPLFHLQHMVFYYLY